MNQQHRPRSRLGLAASGLTLILAAGLGSSAWAADAAATSEVVKTAPAEVGEVVVNGIPFKETVLPTRLSTSSVYGLDLNVMDTPRNTTLLSTTQLETLNIQDPRAFSYLTASSYTRLVVRHAEHPAHPRPVRRRLLQRHALLVHPERLRRAAQFRRPGHHQHHQGPGQRHRRAGAGVGGQADFITKRPSLIALDRIGASASFDTVSNRRWTVDVQGPIIPERARGAAQLFGRGQRQLFLRPLPCTRRPSTSPCAGSRTASTRLDFNGEVNSQQYTRTSASTGSTRT